MFHLDLKITFLCLQPGLNFNLQTLVCICEGPGLLPVGSRTTLQRPRNTQQHNNKPRGAREAKRHVPEEAPADAGRAIVPAAAWKLATNCGWKKKNFYFICCRPP